MRSAERESNKNQILLQRVSFSVQKNLQKTRSERKSSVEAPAILEKNIREASHLRIYTFCSNFLI